MARKPGIALKALQIQHKDATTRLILEWAMHLIVTEKQTVFSHESVAEAAGISARTVYRHFPTRDDLMSALWKEFQLESQAEFVQTEEGLLQRTGELYRSFDRYEGLVRAYLASAASHDHDGEEEQAGLAQHAIERCLERLIGGMGDEHRKQVVAVFITLCSPQAWQVMRDSGGLSGPQAAKAAQLTMAALMEVLRPKPVKPSATAEADKSTPSQTKAVVKSDATQTPAREAGQSTARWKGVYDNPVITKLKKLIPRD
jgi:AcrR family transcriptional regulator